MDPSPPRQVFGQKVRAARLTLGLSQEDLAELSDLHRNYIGGVERGERNISVDNMDRIAQALGTTIGALLGERPLNPQHVKGGNHGPQG